MPCPTCPTCPTLPNYETQSWTPETIAPQWDTQPSNLFMDQIKINKKNDSRYATSVDTRGKKLQLIGHQKVGLVGRNFINRCAATIYAVQPLISGLDKSQPTVGRPQFRDAATANES